jgi:hypothetical protein
MQLISKSDWGSIKDIPQDIEEEEEEEEENHILKLQLRLCVEVPRIQICRKKLLSH